MGYGLGMGLGVHRPVLGGAAAWTPNDIPNIYAWWKGDAGVTTDVDGVASMVDQTGNGHTLEQNTGSKKPGTSTKSGLTTILHDGIDDELTVDFGEVLTQPITLFFVARLVTVGGSVEVMLDGFNDASNRLVLWKDTTGADKIEVSAGSSKNLHNPDTSWHVYTLVFNGASSRHRENTNEITDNAGSRGLDGLTVGDQYLSTAPSDVEWGELGVVNGAISVEDQTLLESYNNGRWVVY
jgi:hypothetical protein